jgi:phage tail sheath protein FI
MPDYHHGVTVTELAQGPRYLRDAKTSTIGLVATADDADAAAFPLDTPVLLDGNESILDQAGSTGTLAKALDAIFDQGNPLMVVVRVAEGVDEATQNSLVIGDNTSGVATGLQALLQAKADFGINPRILGAPGLDTLPVASELVSIADRLRGFAYLYATGAQTKEEAVTYRDNFGSKRAMVIWPRFTGWDTVAQATVGFDPIARALGLRAYLDHTQGWHKSLSNVPVNGVTGLSKSIHWDLQDPNTTAGYLNANEVTALIREDGYRFWGSRTCSTDPAFAFESVVRTGDFLRDTIAEAHLWAIDKPMTRALVFDVVEGINAKLRELKAQGRIVDGKAWLPEDKNTVTTLGNGMLYIDYDYVAVPPLENLLLTQRINASYLIQLVT